jgi:hypothetical protein
LAKVPDGFHRGAMRTMQVFRHRDVTHLKYRSAIRQCSLHGHPFSFKPSSLLPWVVPAIVRFRVVSDSVAAISFAVPAVAPLPSA